MKQLNVIPRYFHVSAGNYTASMFPNNHPLATSTGIMTDGCLESGVVVVSLLLVNWGVTIGVSWSAQLGLPEDEPTITYTDDEL